MMISTLLRNASVAVLLAGAVGAGAHAHQAGGQQQQQQPFNQQQQPEIEPVSDSEVDAFVVAVDEASEVFEEYRPQLQAATDEEATRDIQVELQEAMTVAVTDAGLEPQRYNEIMAAARANPDLAQRISSAAEENERNGE